MMDEKGKVVIILNFFVGVELFESLLGDLLVFVRSVVVLCEKVSGVIFLWLLNDCNMNVVRNVVVNFCVDSVLLNILLRCFEVFICEVVVKNKYIFGEILLVFVKDLCDKVCVVVVFYFLMLVLSLKILFLDKVLKVFLLVVFLLSMGIIMEFEEYYVFLKNYG